jgi:hypothetical protein
MSLYTENTMLPLPPEPGDLNRAAIRRRLRMIAAERRAARRTAG